MSRFTNDPYKIAIGYMTEKGFTTAKEKGSIHYTHHADGPGCYCGEGRWARLPLYAKENFTCTCEQPYTGEEFYFNLDSVGVNKFGVICRNCNKPQRFFVADLVKECEGCERYYLPEWSREGFRAPFLCSDCDRGTLSSRSGSTTKRRRRISWS
jgi:hypothetical protein